MKISLLKFTLAIVLISVSSGAMAAGASGGSIGFSTGSASVPYGDDVINYDLSKVKLINNTPVSISDSNQALNNSLMQRPDAIAIPSGNYAYSANSEERRAPSLNPNGLQPASGNPAIHISANAMNFDAKMDAGNLITDMNGNLMLSNN